MRRTEQLALALALALAFLAPRPAFADKKDDDYRKASEAMNAGRVDEAARLFCQIAQQDPKYKDAAFNCKVMTDTANRENRRNDERFNNGVNDFNAGKFDDAEREFKNIKFGPHQAEAQQYLARIPGARQAQQAQAGDAALDQKFQQAVAAYNRNDFTTAQSLFSQITNGSHAGDAQSYLNKMKQYQQAMAEGDTLANSKNYSQAKSSYDEAAGIKADGPGDPRSKSSQMQQSMASAGRPTPSTTAASTATPEPARAPVVAAVKQPSQPKVDVGKLLADADAARKKGDIRTAQGKYLAVLAADEHNATAKTALAELEAQAQKQATPAQKAGSEADVMLAKAIREFYEGQYEQCEVHVQDYLDVNGSKTGLGYFYQGASKLTRYYLDGGHDAKLMKEAQELFRNAKKTQGFAPPGQTFVSPKILKVFDSTS